MGSERDYQQPRTDLPVLQWIPRWPQRIRWTGFSSAVFIAAFAVLVFVALFKGVANGSWLATAGFVGLAIVFVIMAAHMSGTAGIRYVSLSRRVRSCDHPLYGKGVEIGQQRLAYAAMLTVLAGAMTYGFAAVFAWAVGQGSTLLPAGRDGRTGAMIAGAAGVVLLAAMLLLVLLRNVVTMSIFESGLHRTVAKWRFGRVQVVDSFLPWEDIDDVVADDYVVHVGKSVANPIIRLSHHDAVLDDTCVGQDQKGELVVLAYYMVSEPNMLLALVNFMRQNPDERTAVTRTDAVEMLRPPLLSTRFRLSSLSTGSA
ncbi:hypothetical protein [Rhodococcus sp. BP22]|uniref:hypothetical protein n=1 Tax=Rhodococcus sp. BP22 TaxID=2758566 RepID=UPI001648EDF7|nr:hypothetical protein [Rhodococcus sp. BP22]